MYGFQVLNIVPGIEAERVLLLPECFAMHYRHESEGSQVNSCLFLLALKGGWLLFPLISAGLVQISHLPPDLASFGPSRLMTTLL